jgi:hypothetical protein
MSCLRRYHLPRDREELLYEVTWRLGELETYSDCVEKLARLLDSHKHSVHSRALRRLYSYVQVVREDPVFKSLRGELRAAEGAASKTGRFPLTYFSCFSGGNLLIRFRYDRNTLG